MELGYTIIQFCINFNFMKKLMLFIQLIVVLSVKSQILYDKFDFEPQPDFIYDSIIGNHSKSFRKFENNFQIVKTSNYTKTDSVFTLNFIDILDSLPSYSDSISFRRDVYNSLGTDRYLGYLLNTSFKSNGNNKIKKEYLTALYSNYSYNEVYKNIYDENNNLINFEILIENDNSVLKTNYLYTSNGWNSISIIENQLTNEYSKTNHSHFYKTPNGNEFGQEIHYNSDTIYCVIDYSLIKKSSNEKTFYYKEGINFSNIELKKKVNYLFNPQNLITKKTYTYFQRTNNSTDSITFSFNYEYDSLNRLKKVFLNNSLISTIYYPEYNNENETQNKALKNLTIYPNPFKSELNIVGETIFKDTLVEIFNTKGEKIFYKSSFANNFLQINTNEFEEGLYFIKVNNKTQKVLKY
jgi:hypothetical protein